jgi:hypothetical protein
LNKLQASLLACFAAAAGAAPSDEDMARCAAVASHEARLACYDALAHRPPDQASSAAASVLPSTPPPAAAPTAATTDPKNFGLTAAQQHPTDAGPKAIAAHIAVVSSDKLGHTTVVLDSGQTWTVLDDDGRISAGDAVRIKRAALGSYLMFTPSNHSYSVRRAR